MLKPEIPHPATTRTSIENSDYHEMPVSKASGELVYQDESFQLPLGEPADTLLFSTPALPQTLQPVERLMAPVSSGRSFFLRVRFRRQEKPTIWSAIQFKGTGNVVGMLNQEGLTVHELAAKHPDQVRLYQDITTVGGKINSDPVEFGLSELEDITEDGRRSALLAQAGIRTRELIAAARLREIPDDDGNLVRLPETPAKGEGLFATRCPVTNADLQQAIFSPAGAHDSDRLASLVGIIRDSLQADTLSSARSLAARTKGATAVEFLSQWLPWWAQIQATEMGKLHQLGTTSRGDLMPQNLSPLVEFRDNSQLRVGDDAQLSDKAKQSDLKHIVAEIGVWDKALQYLNENSLLRPRLIPIRLSPRVCTPSQQLTTIQTW